MSAVRNLLCAALLSPCAAFAAVSTSDDRITMSVDGSTLTNTNGGGGAALGWLHNFDAQDLAGLAVEHQVLANSHWTFGSINGSMTRGPAEQRFSLYAEAHEGGGHDGSRSFKYAIEAVGVYGSFYHKLTTQLEDKQINVETTHGNLPKVGLAYLLTPHLLASASYSYSVGGNLGTRLTAIRIDHYGPVVNFLAGYSFGQASPVILVILNQQSIVVSPGSHLNEGYVGVTKPFPSVRGELTLVGDYQDLSGSKHATVTLSYIFHVGHHGSAR